MVEKIDKSIAAEVKEYYDGLIKEGTPIRTAWAVEGILQMHKEITGNDAEWYMVCGRGYVWDAVTSYVRSIKASQESDDTSMQMELLFPGYKRLQKVYSVEREGHQTVVPVELLTDDEFTSMIEMHERMAQGHLLHADELRRYRDGHRNGKAATA
jgi:hypothetical protein